MAARWIVVSLAGLLLALPSGPAAAQSPHTVSLGGRYHTENTLFTDLPFDHGDLSYALAYTFAERYLGLQLAVDVAPDVSGARDAPRTNRTDLAVSPQAHLIVRDRFFRGGVGLLTSYLRDDQGDGDWLEPYWQLQLGLSLPLVRGFSLDAATYYVLEYWGDLAHFRGRDLEYGLWLNYTF